MRKIQVPPSLGLGSVIAASLCFLSYSLLGEQPAVVATTTQPARALAAKTVKIEKSTTQLKGGVPLLTAEVDSAADDSRAARPLVPVGAALSPVAPITFGNSALALAQAPPLPLEKNVLLQEVPVVLVPVSRNVEAVSAVRPPATLTPFATAKFVTPESPKTAQSQPPPVAPARSISASPVSMYARPGPSRQAYGAALGLAHQIAQFVKPKVVEDEAARTKRSPPPPKETKTAEPSKDEKEAAPRKSLNPQAPTTSIAVGVKGGSTPFSKDEMTVTISGGQAWVQVSPTSTVSVRKGDSLPTLGKVLEIRKTEVVAEKGTLTSN